MTETTFFNHSKNIIQEFLSTAIIFDDQASFGDFNTSQPKTVVSPTTRKKKAQEKVDEKNKDATGFEKEEALTLSHDLNAKKVINSFAEKGILCSVIKPEEDELETLHETATLLSEKADLIIFDWELSQTSGKTALPLVKRTITHFNNRSPQQLRLIAIYTGTTNINKVFSQIRDELSKDDFQIEDHGDNCCQIDACRLLVFAKKAAKTAEGVIKVSFEGLADFLVNEYTKMTKGILSNVVMQSFSVIKKNTHQVLKKFSGMDYPFLTHRTCLPSPEEAEDQISTLISEEIQSLLEEYNVGKKSDLNALQYFFDEKPEDISYSIKPLNEKKNDLLNNDHILSWLEKGIPPNDGVHPAFLSKKEIDKLFQHLTMIMSGKKGENFDLKYAALTTLRSKYSENQPYLTLGTVIKELSQETYWVCIQPGCDSVRLSGDVSFPFLPVSEEGAIQCVIPNNPNDSDSFVRKKISIKFSDCQKIIFTADPMSKNIKSMKEADGFCFEDIANNRFQFICELKPLYGQRLSNKFAANISRVATNNSEWLRRCEEKKL
ncbi:response regulator receiver domain [Desulfocicer niacini]